MYVPERHLFREPAMKRHLEHHQQDVLAHLVSPRRVFLIWVLLIFSIATGVLVWNLPVQMHIPGFGLMTDTPKQGTLPSISSGVVIFVEANQQPFLKSGQRVQLQANKASGSFQGVIVQVEPALVNLDTVRQDYHFNRDVFSNVTQPFVTLIVKPEDAFPVARGTVLIATITVGSRAIFSLFK